MRVYGKEDSDTKTKVYYTTEQLLQAIEDYKENRITRKQALEMVKNLINNEGASGRATPFIKAINLITEDKDRDIEDRRKKLKNNIQYLKQTKETKVAIPNKLISVFNFGKKIIKEVVKATNKGR